LNLYEYCGGDPVGGEDASGLVTVHWVDGKPLLVFDTQSMGDAGKIAAAGLTFGAVNYKLSNGARATTDGAYKTSRNLAAAGYVAGAAAGGITVGTALATRIAAARAAAATATTVTTVASTPEGQHLVQHVIQHGWTFVNEHMSVRAQAYQMSVANVCIKMSYKIGNVKFDGADGMRLLEAKGPGYANFVNKYGEFYTWFRGNDALKNQMIRQADAAKSVGFTGVDWYVAEEKAYQAMLLVREKAIAEAPIVRDYINLILRKP
jgi:hypothetical protein